MENPILASEHRAISKRKWRFKPPSNGISYFFLLPAGLFIIIFLIFPLFYNLFLSFRNVSLMNLNGEQQFIGWQNYKTILSSDLFTVAFNNSLVFTIGSIAFQFLLGFALALLFNKQFPGRNIMRSFILLGWMMPIVITGTLFQWIFAGDSGVFNHLLMSIGLIDKPIFWLAEGKYALLGTIIANIWIGIPFSMIILLAGLQSLPAELYEAARIDGAGRFRQFTHITIPLMRPTISILMMLIIIYTFKVFDLIFVMTNGGPVNSTTVFPLYAYKLAFTNYELSLGATVSSLMIAVLVVLATIYLWMMRKEEQH